MRRRLELRALLRHQQQQQLHPAHNPEQHEEIMKEGDSWWLMKIMTIMLMITVILVKAYNASVAFTHGFFTWTPADFFSKIAGCSCSPRLKPQTCSQPDVK